MSDTFFQTIARRYAGGRERLFVLHGNTGDLFPHMEARFTLPDYLYYAILAGGADDGSRVWLHFSLDRGIRWINESKAGGAARLARLLGSRGDELVTFSKEPLAFLRMLMEVSTRREKVGDKERPIPLRVVITDSHLVVPEASAQFVRPDDRELLVWLKRFASEPFYDDTDTLVVLATDALSGINHELREVSVTLEVLRPDEDGVKQAFDSAVIRNKRTVSDADRLAMHRLAVGLTRRQIENIIAAGEVTPAALGEARKELIKRDFGDHLTFFEPKWTLDDVGGSPEAVAELSVLASMFVRGDRDAPSGIILAGQNGIGKTFLAKAFLGTLKRLTGVELRSPLDSLLGASERNWERIATALRSAGQVGVLVDEADAVMGNRSGPNVHEVSQRLFAMQMQLMGDPEYRGKIFWILMTCRPDKLAPDVKRPGRCERVIPLFPVASRDDATTMLVAVQRLLVREGYRFKPDIWAEIAIYDRLIGMTGAQIQRLLRRAKRHAGDTEIKIEHVTRVLDEGKAFDAKPEAGELQRLIAIIEAVETENDDLIPPFYKGEVESQYAGIDGVRERIELLRARLDR